MRMSDTVNVKDRRETMRDLEENISTPSDQDLTTTPNHPDGDDNSQMQRQIPGESARRPKSNAKLKLVRSLAICEEPSPSTITTQLPQEQQDEVKIKLSQAFDKHEPSPTTNEDVEDKSANKLEKMPHKMLSRDSSQDYTDSTGIDLHEFLVNTLRNHPRDRMILLKLEQDIHDFITNNQSQRRKFPPMSSYHRMLLHRVAAYFGLDHNVDETRKCVIINKTSNTRIPDQRFSDHIQDDRTDDLQRRYILQRDKSSTDKDENMIHMKLKDDRRSKSIEEREEEYQRARERIFADGLDTFLLDKRIEEDEACNNIQQRRQIFRLKDGRSGNSRQSSSENEPKYSEPRPWSSTDSDSSSRNLKPAMTKASSFSGIPVLMRGDSSSSSRSVGRLSKTGSDSCSSVDSSTGSLSRPQPPLPVPIQTQPVASLTHSAVSASNALPYEPPAHAASASYYLLPLEAAGIPPGSVLVNPHTGQPFVNQDGSAVAYNHSLTPKVSRLPHQPLPANHVSQPIWSVQPSALPVQHPTVSYPQILSVSNHQQFTVPQDNLSSQFGHMTLLRQPADDAPSAATYPSHPHPQQQAGYMLPCATQNAPPSAFPAPAAVNPSAMQQPQQMAVCYCSPGQCPVSVQQYQYRPMGAVQYSPPSQPMPPQQTGYQTVIPNQQQSYQSISQQNQNQTQASSMNHQMPGMMVQYPSVASYQMSGPSGPQSVTQSYQHSVISHTPVSSSSIQVYYSLLPNQQNNLSSSVGFLPPPGAEQMSFPHTSPPRSSPQIQNQPCPGVPLPPPPAGGMVMMHLSLPAAQQLQSHSPPHWKHNRYFSSEHTRSQKSSDICALEMTHSSPQSSSPAPSPTSTHLSKNMRPGLGNTQPIVPHFSRSFVSGQGDVRCPLLGQPLQYGPQIRPPLLHTPPMVSNHQGPVGLRPAGRGRKHQRKSLSTDHSVGETVMGRVLEVKDLPAGVTHTETVSLIGDLCRAGASATWVSESPASGDPAASYSLLLTFPSRRAAQDALLNHNSPLAPFKLTPCTRRSDQFLPVRPSSQ